VNVIVSDIRGALPLLGSATLSIEDARRRFLAPGGVLIPQRDILQAAVVEAAETYGQLTSPWQNTVDKLDLSSSLPLILNNSYAVSFKREQLLTEPQAWHVLDYTVGAATHLAAQICFRAARTGTAHGVCLWFETQLLGGIGYSSGPGATSTIYGQVFLPWLEPLPLVERQEIQLELRADLVGRDYVWCWNTRMSSPTGAPGVCFQQCTFQGANFSPRFLRCHATDFVPELSEEGQADRWLLQAMDGTASLQQIAQSAFERFPRLFLAADDAFRRAAELAEKLSQ
jgi:protein arginine N-methyltransferase 1